MTLRRSADPRRGPSRSEPGRHEEESRSMRSFRTMAVAAWVALTVVTLWAPPSRAQQDRGAKILANLKVDIPQLAEMNPTMGPITPSGIQGLDQGTFNVGGRPYPFLVT